MGDDIMSKTGLFGIAVLIIIVVSATYRFIEQRKQRISDDNSPIKQYHVEVINKEDIPANARLSRDNDVLGPETIYYYHVTFRLITAPYHDLTLRVKKTDYLAIQPKMTGILFMQGSRFIRFETDGIKENNLKG